MKEKWVDIERYKGLYQISNFGRVKSLERLSWHPRTKSYSLIREKILRGTMETYGYRQFTLMDKKGIKKIYKAHLLVWDTFGSKPRDSYKLQVDHIDNNKLNNRIDNLQLLTPQENNVKYRKTTDRKLPTHIYDNNNSYCVRMTLGGARKFVGNFNSVIEALKARDSKYKEYGVQF